MSKKDKKTCEKIEHPYLLLCEGEDAYWFFIAYLQTLIAEDNIYDNIEVRNFGGIKDLNRYLEMLALIDGFNMVKGIGVVRDAETNAEAAIESLKQSCANLNICADSECGIIKNTVFQDINMSFGYTLLPGKDENARWRNGTLEDICLESLKNTKNEGNFSQIATYGDEYLDKVRVERGQPFKRLHKNKLHTYLSATDKYVNLKIGEAAKAGAFNFSSVGMFYLKEFLGDLVS